MAAAVTVDDWLVDELAVAVDLRLADREPSAVRDAALGLGGVGHYPRQGIALLDAAPVRRRQAGWRLPDGRGTRPSGSGSRRRSGADRPGSGRGPSGARHAPAAPGGGPRRPRYPGDGAPR